MGEGQNFYFRTVEAFGVGFQRAYHQYSPTRLNDGEGQHIPSTCTRQSAYAMIANESAEDAPSVSGTVVVCVCVSRNDRMSDGSWRERE